MAVCRSRVEGEGEARPVHRRLALGLGHLHARGCSRPGAGSPSRPIRLRLYCDSRPACPTRSPGVEAGELRRLELALGHLPDAPQGVGGRRGERIGAERDDLDARPRAAPAAAPRGRPRPPGDASVFTTTGRNGASRRARRSRIWASPDPEDAAPAAPTVRIEVLAVLGRRRTMLKEARFSTRMRPFRSRSGPRGAAMGTSAAPVVLGQLAEVAARAPPAGTRSRPPGARSPATTHVLQGRRGASGRRAGPRRSSRPRLPPRSRQSTTSKSSAPTRALTARPRQQARRPTARRRGTSKTRASRSKRSGVDDGRGEQHEDAGAVPDEQEAGARRRRRRSPRGAWSRAERPATGPPNWMSWTQPAATPASMPWVSPPSGRSRPRPAGRDRGARPWPGRTSSRADCSEQGDQEGERRPEPSSDRLRERRGLGRRRARRAPPRAASKRAEGATRTSLNRPAPASPRTRTRPTTRPLG